MTSRLNFMTMISRVLRLIDNVMVRLGRLIDAGVPR